MKDTCSIDSMLASDKDNVVSSEKRQRLAVDTYVERSLMEIRNNTGPRSIETAFTKNHFT